MVIIVILYLSYNNIQISNTKLLSYLKDIPIEFVAKDAIQENHVVNYDGVITNINLIYDFENDCKNNKTSQLIYTYYNKDEEPTIKTAFYKNGNIFVNIDSTRTTNGTSEIQSYKFNDFKIMDNETTLKLTLNDSEYKINFFNYNKKTGEGS
ncbi:hypothetical protein [Clostridium sp.]|uniref:hypothetical protein n=1 Tax=Clostridium sp. TaxID=1506 RepID=UPI003216E1BD